MFARGSLKKRWRPGLDSAEAVGVAVEALFDAADDDSATGGPDQLRQIYPIVATVTDAGYERVPEEEVGAAVSNAVAALRKEVEAR
jgi:proteasome beta subunit